MITFGKGNHKTCYFPGSKGIKYQFYIWDRIMVAACCWNGTVAELTKSDLHFLEDLYPVPVTTRGQLKNIHVFLLVQYKNIGRKKNQIKHTSSSQYTYRQLNPLPWCFGIPNFSPPHDIWQWLPALDKLTLLQFPTFQNSTQKMADSYCWSFSQTQFCWWKL